jgi:polyhydroxyalkanoate synthase
MAHTRTSRSTPGHPRSEGQGWPAFAVADPFQAWTTLLQDALGAQAAAPVPGADPWLALIERLWQTTPYSKLIPVDPAEMTRAFQTVWLDAIRNPGRAWSHYTEFVQGYTRIMADASLQFWSGQRADQAVIDPERGDKRFSAPDWQRNAVFDALKQSYLLAATTLLRTASEIEGLDAHQQRKLVFYLRQFLDTISPSNYLFTNPQVLHEALETGGQSLADGMRNLLRDVGAGQIKMTDTDAFAPGRNLALTPGQVVLRNKLIELIQYAPQTEQVQSVPLLFIPPWINKFYILDMQPQNSLVRFLTDQGFTVFMISWKNPAPAMDDTTFEDYLKLGPLAALDAVKDITGAAQVLPIGYCIGGTLLSMTLPYLAARGDATVKAATFMVALQDFSEVGDTSVFIDEPQVAYIEDQMLQRGYLDNRQMATMFNMLRANDLIWSNVVNNYLLGKEPPAFDLLYWNADGTRMARAAHSFYLRNTYLENNLIEPGKIVLDGVPIDLADIQQDLYIVGAEQDHIVPWQAAWQLMQLASGKSRFVLAGSGHIAGMINPPTKGRGYRTNTRRAASPDRWLAGTEQHPGSWWTDWVEWLRPRTGKRVSPPSLGSAQYPPVAPAPGTYVMEK